MLFFFYKEEHCATVLSSEEEETHMFRDSLTYFCTVPLFKLLWKKLFHLGMFAQLKCDSLVNQIYKDLNYIPPKYDTIKCIY